VSTAISMVAWGVLEYKHVAFPPMDKETAERKNSAGEILELVRAEFEARNWLLKKHSGVTTFILFAEPVNAIGGIVGRRTVGSGTLKAVCQAALDESKLFLEQP
jgi:hypothetical protein